MPLPARLARMNRRLTNPVLGRLAGRVAPLALLEHRGRRSGKLYRTPVFAFEGPHVVTFALTYGGGVDWLANVRAAGGAALHHRGRELRLGPPAVISPAEGAARMPPPIRVALRLMRVSEFIEMPILAS